MLSGWLRPWQAALSRLPASGQAVVAERTGNLQHTRHEARKPVAVHRRGETRLQPGGGAVAHHSLPRQGERHPRKIPGGDTLSILRMCRQSCWAWVGWHPVLRLEPLPTVCCLLLGLPHGLPQGEHHHVERTVPRGRDDVTRPLVPARGCAVVSWRGPQAFYRPQVPG